MSDRIRAFFMAFEMAWEAVPGYVKVFLYSSISATFGLWVAGELTLTAVAVICMTNLGLYSGPRTVNRMIK